jgi:CHAD domain-containing protein
MCIRNWPDLHEDSGIIFENHLLHDRDYMLSIKRQRKYIRKIKKEAAWQLKKVAGPSSAEDLHRFRVSIKKIRSFEAFPNLSKGKKHMQPLKKIFTQSGNIRDIHNANLMEQDHFALSPVIKNKRLWEFNSAYQKFASRAADYQECFLKELEYLNKKTNSVSFHAIEDHFKKELTIISNCLAKNNAENLHPCRKRLKNLLYLYHVLSKSLQKKLNIRIDYIDQLQDLIGKWHDIEFAEPILKKRINSTQILIITREKENLLKKIRITSENFFNKTKVL